MDILLAVLTCLLYSVIIMVIVAIIGIPLSFLMVYVNEKINANRNR